MVKAIEYIKKKEFNELHSGMVNMVVDTPHAKKALKIHAKEIFDRLDYIYKEDGRIKYDEFKDIMEEYCGTSHKEKTN